MTSRLSPQAAKTRDAILQAALACFAESGLRATTTRTIAARAGVTQPLIHHYFGSKAALFDAVVERSTAEVEQAQAAQWALDEDDLAFFTRGLVVLFRFFGERRELLRLTSWALLEGHAMSTAATRAVFERVRRRLTVMQAKGLLREGFEPEMLVLFLDMLFKGYWMRRDELAAYPVELEGFDARFLAQALELVIHGMLSEEGARRARALLCEPSR